MLAKTSSSINGVCMTKKKILVLDQDKDVCQSIKEYLKEDYDVFARTGVNNILDTIRENNIDLIISDVDLPDGYIYRVLDDLKSSTAKVPVILMYVFFDCSQKMEENIRNMAEAVFLKPFDLQKLKKRIDLLLYPGAIADNTI
jgi:DNA-binding NtrC family response regulator